MIRAIALLLTFLTGFSGLVYEVAWQRYLGTLLGSHSEATASVLAIFLGGLSLGYWIFGRVTRAVVAGAEASGRSPRLLLLYGAIEAGIGVYVMVFPWLFGAVQKLSYAIPHGAVGLGFAIDIGLSALLIGPASVLMGGTIPILTQGLARSLEDATRFHAFVYAFNTAGAFAGALAAGFYLIPTLGLRSVMLSMGLLNLGAGAIFAAVGLRRRSAVSLTADHGDAPSLGASEFRSYVLVAVLTGFAMMALQTIFIRIGVLSLGSSQFTFSMVVAVFVLAIALGSFVVSALPRIPTWVVWANQWALAGLFLLLYLQLDEAPWWLLQIRALFRETSGGFAGYHFLAFLLLAALIGPPVLLSGAALPLLFHHMRRRVGHLGDLAGTLYSWNTVGSLLGALLGGYLLLFWLDLHHVYRLALVALVAAAAVLTLRIVGRNAALAAAVATLLALIVFLPAWRPEILYAGFFRERDLEAATREEPEAWVARKNETILRHADGPTTSVVVRDHGSVGKRRSLGIATDGKQDGDTVGDFDTAAFAAVLPAMMADRAQYAFVIGWGLGITAGELGSYDEMKEVVVAEISHEVAAAGPLFDFASQDATRNPKIRVVEADAYRALMRQTRSYDVIVSAPSHLWASGVEMLFSREFLAAARDRLSPGGVHCQFVHRYEIDDASVAMVLRNYAAVYDHVSIWEDRHDSLFFLGFRDPRWASDHFRLEARAARPDFRATLQRMRIGSYSQLLGRERLPLEVVNRLDLEGPSHSLYHPRLNDIAARAFFRNDFADLPFSGFGEPARVGRQNSLLRGYMSRHKGGLDDVEMQQAVFGACNTVGVSCAALLARWHRDRPGSAVLRSSSDALSRHLGTPPFERLGEIGELLARSATERRGEPTDPARAARATRDFVDFYNHAEPFDPESLVSIWSRCRAPSRSAEACRAQLKATAPDLDGESSEEWLRTCMRPPAIPKECQEGLDEVRRLVSGRQSGQGT